LAMVRMGKVYENLMVDLKATNQKLWDRAARIVAEVAEVTGVSRDQAIELLQSTGGEVKTAIVMQKRGVDAETARRILSVHGEELRTALES
jgi:N-acetylmuramic acid 6-phosphate etherase